LFSRTLSENFGRFSSKVAGGAISESIVILNVIKNYLRAFYTIAGMMSAKCGHESSKHGLLLTSISHALKF
jgi:hypothetical protein